MFSYTKIKATNGFLISLFISLLFFSFSFADFSQSELSSVVKINLLDADSLEIVGGGSGTIVSKDGAILTNYHVIEYVVDYPDDYILNICITLDKIQPPLCDLVGIVDSYYSPIDLALIYGVYSEELLSLEDYFNNHDLQLPVAKFGDKEIKLGDDLQILGYPGAGLDSITYTRGVVSGFLATDYSENARFIKTDAQVNPGNSGGAALNANNEFIGVPSFGFSDNSFGFLDYIIPNNVIEKFFEWVNEEDETKSDLLEKNLQKFSQEEEEIFGETYFYDLDKEGLLLLFGSVIVVIVSIVIWRRAD